MGACGSMETHQSCIKFLYIDTAREPRKNNCVDLAGGGGGLQSKKEANINKVHQNFLSSFIFFPQLLLLFSNCPSTAPANIPRINTIGFPGLLDNFLKELTFQSLKVMLILSWMSDEQSGRSRFAVPLVSHRCPP